MLRVEWVEERLVVRVGHRWVGLVRRGMETALCSLVLWLLWVVWVLLLLLLLGLEEDRSAQMRREVLRVGWVEVRLVVPRVGHRWAWWSRGEEKGWRVGAALLDVGVFHWWTRGERC